MPEVTLSHPLSDGDVAELGLVPGDYEAGDIIDVDLAVALRLVAAGFTTIDPADQAAIAALRQVGLPSRTAGRWFVNIQRQPVNLAAVRAANRTPSADIYRIDQRTDGVLLTALWARAGQQINNTVLTTAEQEQSSATVPLEPSPNNLGGSGPSTPGGNIDPNAPTVFLITTDATHVVDPTAPTVLAVTI